MPNEPISSTELMDNLAEVQGGDFIFIKPDVPHEVFNLSDAEPVVAVVARAAADEWQRIVPYDRDSE